MMFYIHHVLFGFFLKRRKINIFFLGEPCVVKTLRSWKKSSGDHSGNPFLFRKTSFFSSSIFLLPRTNLCFFSHTGGKRIRVMKNNFFGTHESILKKNKKIVESGLKRCLGIKLNEFRQLM